MTNEFNLTPAQKQAWLALLAGKTPRGAKTAMAEAVARAVKSSNTASWKTTVSGFFQGREKELRAIFEHPKRLRAAEEALGLESGQFREWLEEITVGAAHDGPLDVRVVGFEDYGPVPVIDAYFAHSGEMDRPFRSKWTAGSDPNGPWIPVQLDQAHP